MYFMSTAIVSWFYFMYLFQFTNFAKGLDNSQSKLHYEVHVLKILKSRCRDASLFDKPRKFDWSVPNGHMFERKFESCICTSGKTNPLI